MGPLQWWWRTWSKVIDPSQEQELVGALTKAEEQEQRADRLASELNGRDSTVGALEKRAAKAEGEARRVQARASELEDREAQLQSRVDELSPLKAEVTKLREQQKKADAELERLRSRVKDADTDRAELERLRSRIKDADTDRAELERLRSRIKDADTDRAEVKRLRSRVKELESRQQAAPTGEASDAPSTTAKTSDAPSTTAKTSDAPSTTAKTSDGSGAAAGGGGPDVSGATKVLGRSVNLDDLTVVEGIGPKIASLLSDAGISTWRALSDAEPDRLRGVLQDAGPRYRVHDPGSWPRQAALLADGKWQEFKDLRAKVRSR
jgi:predicted flap endonuclease-1-like 5' DNA nuclease